MASASNVYQLSSRHGCQHGQHGKKGKGIEKSTTKRLPRTQRKQLGPPCRRSTHHTASRRAPLQQQRREWKLFTQLKIIYSAETVHTHTNTSFIFVFAACHYTDHWSHNINTTYQHNTTTKGQPVKIGPVFPFPSFRKLLSFINRLRSIHNLVLVCIQQRLSSKQAAEVPTASTATHLLSLPSPRVGSLSTERKEV